MFKKLIIIAASAACLVSCISDGQTISSSYVLKADFEVPGLFAETDSLFYDKNGGYMIWQDLAFCNGLNKNTKEYTGGFMISRLPGVGSSDKDRFRVNSGKGQGFSSNYIVYYTNPDASQMPEYDILFMASKVGSCALTSCYVNNTKEVVRAVRKNFELGDKLTLKLSGYKAKELKGTAEVVLAEFYEGKDSIMTTWQKVSLENMGSIDYIEVEVKSTNAAVPAAFCMDQVEGAIEISY